MGKFPSSHKLSFVYNIARYTKWKNSLVNFCQKSKSSHDVGLTDIFKSKQSEGDNFLAKNKLGISLLVTFTTRKKLKARLNHIRFNLRELLNLILSAVIPNVISIMIKTTKRMQFNKIYFKNKISFAD